MTPLNEHVLDNRERLLKALIQRDYVIAEDGRIRWSPFLLSGKIKPINKLTEEKVKEIDLILKNKEFMERIESCAAQFHLEILKFCDGFQVNLSATKDIADEKKKKLCWTLYLILYGNPVSSEPQKYINIYKRL